MWKDYKRVGSRGILTRRALKVRTLHKHFLTWSFLVHLQIVFLTVSIVFQSI